jgi:dihydrofolate reductase
MSGSSAIARPEVTGAGSSGHLNSGVLEDAMNVHRSRRLINERRQPSHTASGSRRDEYAMAGKVAAAVAVSLDGFIAGPGDRPGDALGVDGDRLFTWFYDGDTPGRFYPWMKMSAASAAAFDGFIARIGAVISGRRTYDVTNGWEGKGEVPGAPLFVVTHRVPEQIPAADPPYTFVTDGVASAVSQALAAAAGRDVRIMGASIVQQCLRSGLLDELTIELVPALLGRGTRLLDGLKPETAALEIVRVVDAPGVTHLTYQVRN